MALHHLPVAARCQVLRRLRLPLSCHLLQFPVARPVRAADRQSIDPQDGQKYYCFKSADDAFLSNRGSKIEISNRKSLGSEINRARHCYSNPSIIATTHANSEIVLTYINEERSEVISKLICHTQDGYGLSWNPKFYSVLASGHSDKRICIWDV